MPTTQAPSWLWYHSSNRWTLACWRVLPYGLTQSFATLALLVATQVLDDSLPPDPALLEVLARGVAEPLVGSRTSGARP